MADYDLKYTGQQIDALLDAANELKTNGYIYKGVATPSTNPGTPTERVAYLASEPGTYTNFGGIVITSGLYSLTYASGTWTSTQMQAGSDIEVVQTTGQSASDVMSQKAVSDLPFVKNGYNINEDGFNIADGERNVGLRYDNDGLDAGKLNPHFVELLKSEGVAVDCIASVEEDGLYVVDGTLNVGVKVDNDGIHAENVLEFLTINY